MPLRDDDIEFGRAVELLDAGDAKGLRLYLAEHPDLARRRGGFEGFAYFRNPALLQFVAENPIRNGTLPANIVEVAKTILDAGARTDQDALDQTLALVCSGCVPRQCGVQIPLIRLLCDYGADREPAMRTALPHGEFEAANELLRLGARLGLPAAAALGLSEDARRLLPAATDEERHQALALAAQFGRTAIVGLLLDAGEDPSRYNPAGFHGHSTPLHQAALAGHFDVVRLLAERGARRDLKDRVFEGTPRGWAIHGGHGEIAAYLDQPTNP
jgi:hypothetical protein